MRTKENFYNKTILLLGGAGLVGQNLAVRLIDMGCSNLIVIDKHRANLNVMKKLCPSIVTEFADLAETGSWQHLFKGVDIVVMLQAQIGGNDYEAFVRNNVTSTKNVLHAIKENDIPYLIHISSSVVQSVSDDFYTNTKKEQEALVLASNVPCIVLRPTLMFGWFDRKHLGWLSRFMKKVPIFPIPGHGRYVRQPLYVGDFCSVIISSIENNSYQGIYNISGHEKVFYIDIIREIRKAIDSKVIIVKIPYMLFSILLKVWSLFDKNPPFTTQQLAALVAEDEFEISNWPSVFHISRTPFVQAIDETFNDSHYGDVTLEF